MRLAATISSAHIAELVRYYQASILNTAFGYGLFFLFIWAGFNIFLAQLTAHIIGTAFNYFTHSRHSFRATQPAKIRFALAYTVLYLLSAALLALFALYFRSPYVAGACAAITASILNYFILKKLVFLKDVLAL